MNCAGSYNWTTIGQCRNGCHLNRIVYHSIYFCMQLHRDIYTVCMGVRWVEVEWRMMVLTQTISHSHACLINEPHSNWDKNLSIDSINKHSTMFCSHRAYRQYTKKNSPKNSPTTLTVINKNRMMILTKCCCCRCAVHRDAKPKIKNQYRTPTTEYKTK